MLVAVAMQVPDAKSPGKSHACRWFCASACTHQHPFRHAAAVQNPELPPLRIAPLCTNTPPHNNDCILQCLTCLRAAHASCVRIVATHFLHAHHTPPHAACDLLKIARETRKRDIGTAAAAAVSSSAGVIWRHCAKSGRPAFVCVRECAMHNARHMHFAYVILRNKYICLAHAHTYTLFILLCCTRYLTEAYSKMVL